MGISPEVQFDSNIKKLIGPCGKVQLSMYYPCILEEVLQCLMQTWTYIRIREINKKQYVQNEERKKKKIKKLFPVLQKRGNK